MICDKEKYLVFYKKLILNAINSFDQYEFASVYSEEYAWNYITHQYLELFKKTYENN